ncbi:exo-alpha-sialidase [Gaoshiqia sp. Z1-71]|uniref:exo-alpha-sialidase n=1 Tax=Gaoshiqia hydrogeniformans TaxID=3290090 RepID=UPI003BF79852
MSGIILSVALCVLLGGCKKSDDPVDPYELRTGEPVEGIRIAWDYSSMQRLAPQGNRVLSWVGYPRVRRLNDGRLMAVYETHGNGELVQSADDGNTWSEPVITFKQHTYTNGRGETTDVNIANTELIQLQNGDLVMACNYRPAKDEIAPFAIAVRRSADGGQSWTESHVIYEAGPRFKDGCWEPAFLQLPNGELQVYFANENPFLTSDEQNISMMFSADNGISWDEEIKTVCFREGRRDGMPVPLLVNDEIIVAIEDNKIGQFKPYIVRTKVSENWQTPVLGNSPNRESALKEPLPDAVYAGAPYLMKLPSGEVILSYQTTSGRSADWERSTLEVAIGDKTGRNFTKLSRPFAVPLDREAKWNSVSLWDEHTVVAAATTSFRSPNCEVWIIRGHVIPELKAQQATISTDGNLTQTEWENEWPVFIGHRSETNLRAGIRKDGDKLYVGVDVNDKQLTSDANNLLRADGVYLYLDANNQNLLEPGEGLFRFWCNYKGETKAEKGDRGQWKAVEVAGAKAVAKTKTDAGYRIEFEIPFAAVQKDKHSDVRINLGLVDYSQYEGIQEENLANSVSESSNTWCRVAIQ